jgi:hypothetical protein
LVINIIHAEGRAGWVYIIYVAGVRLKSRVGLRESV